MMIKQLCKMVTFVLFCVVLSSCAQVMNNRPYEGLQASNDMQQILSDGMKQNQDVDRQASAGVPTNVSNSLMPALEIKGSAKEVKQQAERFNIAANAMPAEDFFMGLVKGTKLNMMVSPAVKGQITLNLQNVTIDEALQAVQDSYGYQYERTTYGYQIFPHELQTRTFTVNYLDVKRSSESNTRVSSGQISEKVTGSTNGSNTSNLNTTTTNTTPTSEIETKTESEFWKSLKDTLTEMIGDQDGRKVIVNPNASLVIVRAYPSEFREVTHYLDLLERNMTREVIIEAKVLEVELNAKYQAGIDWSILGLQQNNGLEEDLTSDLTKLATGLFTLHLSYKQVFNTVIRMLSSQGNVQTLSSPHIATMNNQTAVIKVGDDEFFVTNVSSTTTAGATSTTTQNLDLTPFFSGISLDVTPQIAGNGDVILHIHPVISTVTDQTKSFKVNGADQVLPLAHSSIRESDNIVRAKNNQVVVIGGLMSNTTSENRADVPGLSKAPVVGALFRRNDQSFTKTELVILLRPTVIKGFTWSDQVKRASDNIQGVDRGFAEGAHPRIFGAKDKKQW